MVLSPIYSIKDHDMPPPKKRYRVGSPDLECAVQSGEIELSIGTNDGNENFPPQELVASWNVSDREESEAVDGKVCLDDTFISTMASGQGAMATEEEKDNAPLDPISEGLHDSDELPISDGISTNMISSSCDKVGVEETSPPPVVSSDEINDGDSFQTIAPCSETLPRQPILPPETKLDDIVGQAAAKLRIEEVLLPLLLPKDFADSIFTGIRAMKPSILLHGPPGCGKTCLAEAIAGEAEAALLSVGPGDILSKFVGESETHVRAMFEQARSLAQDMPSKSCVLFFDEIDAIGQSRGGDESQTGNTSGSSVPGADACSRRVLTELLLQLNHVNENIRTPAAISEEVSGLEQNQKKPHRCRQKDDRSPFDSNDAGETNDSGVQHDWGKYCSDEEDSESLQHAHINVHIIVVAATNRPGDIDSALMRRFGIRVHVGLPTQKDRKKIVSRLLVETDHVLSTADLDQISTMTEGWSGSDLESLAREAAMAPIRQCIRSAALSRRRNRNKAKISQAQTGAEQNEVGLQSERENIPSAERKTQDVILDHFRNLQPVTWQDFEDALTFCCGGGKSQGDIAGSCNKNLLEESSAAQPHYDSSSEEED